MTMFTSRLGSVLLVLATAVMTPAAAMAACSDLESISPDQLGGLTIAAVQTGARSALGDDSRFLGDGYLGRYTRKSLARLCELVPRAGEAGDVPGTLDLTREYADLTGLMPDWPAALSASALTAGLSAGAEAGPGTLPMRLAGPPQMTVPALGGAGELFPCAGAEAALTDAPTAAEGARLLRQLYGAASTAELCESLPMTGSAADFAGAMARFARIEAALPGALRDLQAPNFARWMAINPGSHRLRLVGTESAVLRLVEEFRALEGRTTPPEPVPPPVAAPAMKPAPARPKAPPVVAGPCTPDTTERTLTYYALSKDEISALQYSVDLSPVFQQFREKNPGFDNREAFLRALRETLSPVLDTCILDAVDQLVTGPVDLALQYHLDPERAANLVVKPEVQPVVPVLQRFADIRTPTEDALLQGIRAALADDRGKVAAAEVEKAAETMAAASEPEQEVTDIAPENVPVPDLPPPPPQIVVTEATDKALADTISNDEILKVLAATPFPPATSPELIRSQVRGALRGVAAEQTAREVDGLMTEIQPAVASNWSLTPGLEEAILAIPYVAAAIDDVSARNLPERMKTLSGIAYPSFRQFAAALGEVPPADGWAGKDPFSEVMRNRIIMKAQKKITDAAAPRSYGPLQTAGCNCVSERLPNAEVYAFYPFWSVPPISAQPVAPALAAEAGAAVGEAVGEAPGPSRARVDFEIVSRVAFYGLELALERGSAASPAGEVKLSSANQWAAAKRSFVNSAHRYRAKADVAIDIRGWKTWSDENIDQAVTAILAQMQPFNRFEGYGWDEIKAALPTLFDPVQPDGVTLIFDDHLGNELDSGASCRMTQIISRVYLGLADPEAQTINIGVGFKQEWDVAGAWEIPLFNELEHLLVDSDQVSRRQCDADADAAPEEVPAASHARGPRGKVVDMVMLFFERPTAASAQFLRYRMEVSKFSGKRLAAALRSIIPVLPPGANHFVRAKWSDEPYAQFREDIAYFQDNFGGVGFWPAPLPPQAESEDATQVERVLVRQLGGRAALFGGVFASSKGAVCGLICPNRAYLDLAAIAMFLSILALTWRSFYSGIVDRIAFRVWVIGLVWIGNIVLVAALFLLVNCDPVAFWPQVFLYVLIVGLGLVLIYNFIQRVKNGPMP